MLRNPLHHALAVLLVALAAAAAQAEDKKLQALIVDGQNNHQVWPQTFPPR